MSLWICENCGNDKKFYGSGCGDCSFNATVNIDVDETGHEEITDECDIEYENHDYQETNITHCDECNSENITSFENKEELNKYLEKNTKLKALVLARKI